MTATAVAGDDERPVDEAITRILAAGTPAARTHAVGAVKAWLANRPPAFTFRVSTGDRSAVIILLGQSGLSSMRDVRIVQDDTVPTGHVIVQRCE